MNVADIEKLEKLAKLVRYYILRMSTKAGSGHPTSSLSAADLMTALFFGHLKSDDRVIFSKGHASPLLYALYAAGGELSEKEIDTYRQFGSVLEGHPSPRFKFVDVATGSLGQGLSIGVGMAVAARIAGPAARTARGPVTGFLPASTRSSGKSKGDQQNSVELRAVGNPPSGATPRANTLSKVYVLMGDSEVAEGSVWEAIQIASYYKLNNLVGIIDVNRLGQSTTTMLEWDTQTYAKRVGSFGWEPLVIDGHNMKAINQALAKAAKSKKPVMIIAKTIKGKGLSFLENKEGWHGKALSEE